MYIIGLILRYTAKEWMLSYEASASLKHVLSSYVFCTEEASAWEQLLPQLSRFPSKNGQFMFIFRIHHWLVSSKTIKMMMIIIIIISKKINIIKLILNFRYCSYEDKITAVICLSTRTLTHHLQIKLVHN